MNDLRAELDRYLAIRRSLGFKLHRAERLLGDFIGYLAANSTDTITTANAFAWATLPADASSDWWAQRLSVVRAFARHLHVIDPAHEVPPAGLLAARSHRAVPYLYSDAEIAALMAAARQFRSPLRAATFETLVGLLAVTGLRIGEALRLDRDDVDLAEGVLRIRETKFGKSRDVPLHGTTVEASLPTRVGGIGSARTRSIRRSSSRPPGPGCCTATRTPAGWSSCIAPDFNRVQRSAGPGRMI